MAKDFLKADPIGDFEQIFNQDFNKLIRKVHKGLSTKKRSPVYTGFFASSWKAQTMGVKAKDKVENYKPWAEFARIGKNLKKGEKPPSKIEPRFSPPTFDYKKGCFVGNQAEYSNYVIEDPRIAKYVKNDIKNVIDENFQEKKRGAIKLGAVQKKVLFGKGSKKGRKYTGTSEF